MLPGSDSIERRVIALAEDIRGLLDEVLEQTREGDWDGASRRTADLAASLRRLQNEVDFCSMNVWLERARTA